ncbi:MAG TPA: sulfate ABC transporter substrate-binding protein [Solirubrobacteraceae bacterium]|nr:sulfate ABC transporter substrate-binding protein [Solirubrobacteraceae bacterium]
MHRHASPLAQVVAALVALAVVLAVAGCGGASDSATGAAISANGATKLALVAYSTPQVVYDQVVPAFQQTAAGKGVGVTTSFGPSGEQSRSVAAGLPADVVSFSIQPDMQRLVKAGIVAPGWSSAPYHGLVNTSLVTFVVRKGNPKGIHTWSDLLKPDVEVLTPNPFTSGSAKWNLLAAYGQASNDGRDPQAGLAYVKELLTRHVKVQDKSAREALQDFASGNGDVLLSYESEAITAQKKGQDVDYVTPDETIRIDIPIAVTTTSEHPAQAQALVDYTRSAAAQQVFADWGYRPVNPAVLKANAAKFPVPPGLFTIDDLGGWATLDSSLFDVTHGSIAKIEQQVGVSTAK